MTDHNDLERKISKAFKNATPNVLDAVLRDCENMKGQSIMTIERKTNWVKRVVAVAAAIVLVLGLGVGIATVSSNNAVASVVSLDVNPSIEIKVNKNERVLQVVPLNDDGVKVIGDMDFKGSDIDVAINALIGSMLREGYLNDLANSILISVDGDDSAKNAELQARLAQEIDKLLNTDDFSGSVLSQTVTHDTELDTLAEQYGITAGKAQLIRQITSQNTHYTFEDLAKLTINELNLISISNGTNLDNVTATGAASDKKYIGADAAKIAAIKHSGYFDSIGDVDTMTYEEIFDWIDISVNKLECELDYDDGKMVYEIEFEIGYYDYEYDIDAKTGEILLHSKEFDNENVSPKFDGIDKDFNFELEGEHDGVVDGVIAESGSKYDAEYLFAAEFVKEFDTFIFSNDPKNRFSEYISDEELLEYTTVLAEGANILNQAIPRHGAKIAYVLIEDKTYTIDDEHTVVYVAEDATFQYEGAQVSSGYGNGWSVIVKELGNGKYEIVDWYMGKDGYDMSARGINAEFGDVGFWNAPEKYESVLSGAHSHYDYLSSLYTYAPNTSSPSADPTSYISREEARSAAVNHAGVNDSDVREFECEFDHEDGLAVYEIDFEVGQYDYDYEINAETGAVVRHSKKFDDDNIFDDIEDMFENNDKPASSQNTEFIGNDAAKSAALKHAGVSASDARGIECELDRADDLFEKDHYDVEFSSGGYDYEYEIDAQTGEVLRNEKERDD